MQERSRKRLLARMSLFGAAALLAAAYVHTRNLGAQVVVSGSGEAASGTLTPGQAIVANWQSQPPALTPERRAQLAAAHARSHRSGPTDLPYAAMIADGGGPGPAVPRPGAAAPGDLVAYDNVVNPIGTATFVQEPSADNSGSMIFQSGNWYATASFDHGVTWNYVDPNMFGAGFCCDQVVVYDPGRDAWFWLLQYADHLVLANSRDLVNWCSYTWYPGDFGFSGELDYNDLAVTTNYVYIMSNIFPATGGMGSTIARVPIDAQLTCSGLNYNFITRTDLGFTWKAASGLYDVLYWGTNWFGNLGSSFRVFKWAENSGGFNWVDSNLNPTFAFYVRNSGQNCGSTDGVITNWCQFADSRVLGGARYTDPDGTARLVFSFNAKQGGPFGLAFPSTERVHFKESDLSYIASDRLFGDFAAFQFTSLSTDARGHVGMTTTYGGGVGGSDYYPSGVISLQDDVAPAQPWSYAYQAFGSGNTCTYGGLYRWGDYNTTRPFRPTNLGFLGMYYIITGGDCGTLFSTNEPHQTTFGRARDIPGAFQRWPN